VEWIFSKQELYYVQSWSIGDTFQCAKHSEGEGCSGSQVAQGNTKYIRSKHVELGNKLAEVRFCVNIFNIAFGVGVFKSVLAKHCWIALWNCFSFTSSFKSPIQRSWCFCVKYNLEL